MRIRVVLRLLGSLLKILSMLLLVPGGVASYYGETRGVLAFALTAIISLLAGIILAQLGSDDEMGHKEGFALVAFGWLAAAFLGALPYYFLGTSMVDGLFESMSAFTTTGSSILVEYDTQGYWIINKTLADRSLAVALAGDFHRSFGPMAPGGHAAPMPIGDMTYMGLLFWRSFAQWLGGMGIILLFIAILPKLGVAGRQLYKAENPGPDKETITPRIRETAKLLWWVYLIFTLLEVALLWLAGMTLYDSLCSTFATMATGGFSPRCLSIMAYKSVVIDGIIIAFMFLAGTNFALHYRMLYTDRKALIKDPEFRFYAAIILAATAVVMLWGGLEGDVFFKLRLALFQVVSIMTTTGFITADYDRWTAAARMVLFLLMLVGACAGSTGGAIKVVRLLLVLKRGFTELKHALHPKAVIVVKLAGVPVKDEVLRSSNIFFALYPVVFAIAALLLAIVSYNDPRMTMESIISAVAATLGNIGPGFGNVGPMSCFADVHPLGKIILLLCMWIGRLEIITVLVLLVPDFWRK